MKCRDGGEAKVDKNRYQAEQLEPPLVLQVDGKSTTFKSKKIEERRRWTLCRTSTIKPV